MNFKALGPRLTKQQQQQQTTTMTPTTAVVSPGSCWSDNPIQLKSHRIQIGLHLLKTFNLIIICFMAQRGSSPSTSTTHLHSTSSDVPSMTMQPLEPQLILDILWPSSHLFDGSAPVPEITGFFGHGMTL